MKITKENWNIGLTPQIGTSETKQNALNWWNELPAQDIYGHLGWANLCMHYYPTRTECYHFTEDEVLYMWEQEHLNVK